MRRWKPTIEQLETRVLLAGDTPDIFEPNDSRETAFDLGTNDQFHQGLSTHSFPDDDWFKWTASQTGQLRVELHFQHLEVDLDLALRNQNGIFLDNSDSTSDDEQVTINVNAGESYFIHVDNFRGDEAEYDLLIDGPQSDFPADAFEIDNDFAQATNIGSSDQTLSGLSIHAPFDSDFFVYTANESGTLQIDAIFSHNNGNLDLELYDSTQTLIDSSTTSSDNEQIIVNGVESSDQFFIRVFGPNGVTNNSYALIVDGPQSIPLGPDLFEPNNSPSGAAQLGTGDVAFNGLSLHTDSDLDYFNWTASMDGTVSIDANFIHVLGDVSLIVRDSSQTLLGFSVSQTDNEHVSLPVSAGDTLSIQVSGANGATQPSYDLVIDGPAASTEPPDPLVVESTSIPSGTVFTTAPGFIDLDFSQEIDTLSLGVDDLSLSTGSVTNATALDGDTVRYSISLGEQDVQVTYTLNQGVVSDVNGTPNDPFQGTFLVGNPAVMRFDLSDVSIPIPDNGEIMLPMLVNIDQPIRDLDVELTILHSWDPDIDAHLIAPDGTEIELFTDVGFSGSPVNFIGTILDDEADTFIANAGAPFTGRYQPEGTLADVDGMSTAGVWMLRLADDFPGITGSLQSWTLAFEVNSGPVFDPIPDRTIQHSADFEVIPVTVVDLNGDTVTVSAEIDSKAYQLDQQLDLVADELILASNYGFNTRGRNEKYFRNRDGSTWYYLVTDGTNAFLHEWVDSFETSPLLATLDARFHDDPSLLHDALAPADIPVTLSVDPITHDLTVDLEQIFQGTFQIRLTATDGIESTQEVFWLDIVNLPVTIQPIPDQQMSSAEDTFHLVIPVTNPDSDPLTYDVSAIGVSDAEAYELDTELNLFADDLIRSSNYGFNLQGQGEKFFRGGDGNTWYYLTTDGSASFLHRWEGSFSASPLIATLGPSIHENPALLHDAVEDAVLVSALVTGNSLTLDPDDGFLGEVIVEIEVSDGENSDSQDFVLRVQNVAPSLAALSDVIVPHTIGSFTVPLSANDLDGDSVVLSAELVAPEMDVAQHVGLAIDQVFDRLTITIDNRFVGQFEVMVSASDGMNVAEQQFSVNVTNQPVSLGPIANRQISTAQDTVTISLSVSNPDNDPLTFSVDADAVDDVNAYVVDRDLNLFADPAILDSNYGFDSQNRGEKYFRGGDGSTWYYLINNGTEALLYRWEGSFDTNPLISTFDVSIHDNPALLHDARENANPVDAFVNGTNLTVDPSSTFVGTIVVTTTVSDGPTSDTEQFVLEVENGSPTLAPISDRSVVHSVGSFSVQLVASDPENDPITLSADVVSDAYQLDQERNLFADEAILDSNYGFNVQGRGEKYFRGGDGTTWYYLIPDGDEALLYRWVDSFDTNPLIATLDIRFHDDPSLLHDAVNPMDIPVTLTVDQATDQLDVAIDHGFLGAFDVAVTASDGFTSAEQRFSVTVTNDPVALSPISDQQMPDGPDVFSLPLSVVNSDADPLTYSAQAVAVADPQAYMIDKQLGLFADNLILSSNYGFNAQGRGEKYFRGGDGTTWYYLITDGSNSFLHRWEDSFENSPLIATLDAAIHENPALLHDAEQNAVPVNAFVVQDILYVDPDEGFVGDVLVSVTVSDGPSQDTQSFILHVGNQ